MQSENQPEDPAKKTEKVNNDSGATKLKIQPIPMF